jgi:hypothetical protein
MAVFLALTAGARHAAAQEPRNVTYGGAIEGGGAVQITLTPDSTAVSRVEVTDATFLILVPGKATRTIIVSRELYFVPPVRLGDGVDATLPIDIDREARSSVRLVGSSLTDGGFSGTAMYHACVLGTGCSDQSSTTWSATERIDMPPRPDDRVFSGSIAVGGSIQVALSPDGDNVTWVSIRDLPAEACPPGDPPFAIDVFFDPPAPLDQFSTPLVQTSTNLQTLALSASRDDGTIDGDLSLATFRSDCTVEARWSATAVEPPATVSPRPTERPATSTPPAVELPQAGGGPRSEAALLWLWGAMLAALLGSAALAIARPR